MLKYKICCFLLCAAIILCPLVFGQGSSDKKGKKPANAAPSSKPVTGLPAANLSVSPDQGESGLSAASAEGENMLPTNQAEDEPSTLNPAEGVIPRDSPQTAALAAQAAAASEAVRTRASRVVPAGHRGIVNAIVYDEKAGLLSVGEDGFLEIWSAANNAAKERLQISTLPLTGLCLRPGKANAAVVETDGKANRVSVWDYNANRQLFSADFQGQVGFVGYSAGGSFLMVAKANAIDCLDAETGRIIRTIKTAGTVALAATGKSERNMVAYTASGVISYWDLKTGAAITQVNAPNNIQAPVLFGNSGLIAGIQTGSDPVNNGLVVVNAVSGKVIDRKPSIMAGIVFPKSGESSDFFCLSSNAPQTLFSFSVSGKGLETKKQSAIPKIDIKSAGVFNKTTAFGAKDGNVWFVNQTGNFEMMGVQNQKRIQEAAAAGDSLAVFAGDQFGLIPLDYTQITANSEIGLEKTTYTRATSVQNGLVLWQEKRPTPGPVFRTFQKDGYNDTPLKFSTQFPLRTVSALNDKALFLDSVGNITVISVASGKTLFSFSSAGSQDAVFLDDKNIIVGQGDVSGTSPFLKISIATGETVPITYPAAIGIRVYKGENLYGAVYDQNSQQTILVKLDPVNSSKSVAFASYPGEDMDFAITETAGSLIANLGNGRAIRYPDFTPLEQDNGFPVKLLAAGPYLISIDTDGTLAWYDPQTANLLARLHLYENDWLLETTNAQLVKGKKSENG